jgi:hypothetical protein
MLVILEQEFQGWVVPDWIFKVQYSNIWMFRAEILYAGLDIQK